MVVVSLVFPKAYVSARNERFLKVEIFALLNSRSKFSMKIIDIYRIISILPKMKSDASHLTFHYLM